MWYVNSAPSKGRNGIIRLDERSKLAAFQRSAEGIVLRGGQAGCFVGIPPPASKRSLPKDPSDHECDGKPSPGISELSHGVDANAEQTRLFNPFNAIKPGIVKTRVSPDLFPFSRIRRTV